MLCVRKSFLLALSFLVTFSLILQLRTLYHNHQRNLRLQDYEEQLHNLKHTMTHIEKVANRSRALLENLQKQKKPHKLQNKEKNS